MPSGTLKTFQFLGLTFDWTTIISTSMAFVLVLAIVIFLSRKLSIRPGKRQNFLEWTIDFTNRIVKDQIPTAEGSTYRLYIFTLFLFIFVSNQMGLFLQFGSDSA
ncbi:F0F1 ATP synthase subunit A, partial [Oenococcus oeni]